MEDVTNAKDTVCIIVILFNPRKEQIRNVESLASSFCVFAIDNSERSSEIRCTYYIPLNKNIGIAAAQNVGIKHAIEHGFKYIVFFDQDSRVQFNYIYDILEEYKTIKRDNSKIASLGPLIIEEETDKEYKNTSSKLLPYSKVDSIISSGSIVESVFFDIVGLYEEELFIDLVDCEWCWRAVDKGYEIFLTRRVKLHHTVGKKCVKILGINFGVASSSRYFYYTRNLLWLCRRKYVPTSFKVKSLIRLLAELIVIPLISEEGFACTRNMLKGFFVGIKSCNYDCNN